jgi:hypothetical protein
MEMSYWCIECNGGGVTGFGVLPGRKKTAPLSGMVVVDRSGCSS